jgi:hypothetical protein
MEVLPQDCLEGMALGASRSDRFAFPQGLRMHKLRQYVAVRESLVPALYVVYAHCGSVLTGNLFRSSSARAWACVLTCIPTYGRAILALAASQAAPLVRGLRDHLRLAGGARSMIGSRGLRSGPCGPCRRAASD